MYNNEKKIKNFSYAGQPQATNIRNGFNGINKRHEDNFHLAKQSNKPHITLNEHGPHQKMNNLENGVFCPQETRNMKFYSAFEEVKKNFEDNSVDRGYHTIEKSPVGSSVNFRNNYNLSQNQKLVKERPNSFSCTQKSNGTSLNNEYNPKTFEKYPNGSSTYENQRMFKPILKSFASEDNLNTEMAIKERSKSTERLDNVAATFSNNKNRVRWNLQEKTKNMINLKEDNSYYKPRDYNSLNRIKPNNIHNVKNDVVYAGKGEIIEIKNNQIINIKTAPQQPSQITFKKENNSKAITNNRGNLFKDEISTEL